MLPCASPSSAGAVQWGHGFTNEEAGETMTKKLLMGNEAFAHAALEAGVRVVAG